MPGDYSSFSMAILSQNHREMNIAELILLSLKVIIACTKGFFNTLCNGDSLDIDNMTTSLTAWGVGNW